MAEIIKGSVLFKHKPEDFIVEEMWGGEVCKISEGIECLENANVDFGKLEVNDRRAFLTCDLEKINIDHFTLMSILYKEIGNFQEDICWAGTKDRNAWTAQKISIFRPNIEKIRNFSFPMVRLKNFKWAKRRVNLGDHTSNRFTVVLRDADNDSIKILNKIRNSEYIPNFFGSQRFGSLRKENVRIGILIFKEKFQEAVFEYLTAFGDNEYDETIKAKKRLKTEKDLLSAREYFPKNLRIENRILDYLHSHPGNWIGALRIIGEKTLLLMAQSVQSKFFNDVLEQMIDNKLVIPGQNISLLGCNSNFSSGKIGKIEKEVLESYNLELKDFAVKKLPFLSLNGSTRNAFFKVEVIDVDTQQDEIFTGNKKIVLIFNIVSGSYATTFLEHFFDFR